ncbi:MAG: helix-turn-helix domain-containing protein [Bacteroidota bacterium]
MGLFELISLLGLIQGIIIALLILRSKVFQNDANQYFAYFLLVLSVIGFDSLLSPYYSDLPKFWFTFFDIVGDDIPWVMMFYLPLFTFFLKSTSTSVNVSVRYFYIPFWLFVVINFFIDLDLDFHLISVPALTENRFIFYELEDYIALLLTISLHTFVYVRMVRNFGNQWIRKLWWYSSVIILIWIILLIDLAFFDSQNIDGFINMLWISVSIFIYWLMYSGLLQFNLSNNRSILKKKLNNSTENQRDKSKAGSKSDQHYQALQELMINQHLYRNPNLGREDIASELGISPSYLTQLLKENAGKNFTSFVNEYRVKAVEQMLLDPSFEPFDVLSIGLEAGFKSKSAYYSTFKSINGLTPAQFKRLKS